MPEVSFHSSLSAQAALLLYQGGYSSPLHLGSKALQAVASLRKILSISFYL